MMRQTPCADRQMAIHAMLDGELDAMAVVELESHLRLCGTCRQELERLEHLRNVLAGQDLRHAAPAALRARVAQMAAPQRPARQNRPLGAWMGGAIGGALAASLALLIAVPDVAEPGLTQAVVDGHIRSLQAGHLTDVAMSDRHVVKPWFNGRLSFAPPVPDLAQAGFALSGGRMDVLDGRDVAVLVYRRHLHTINLFVRPAPRLPLPLGSSTRRAGFGVEHWRMDGLEFLAVSDLDPGDLSRFRADFITTAHSSAPER